MNTVRIFILYASLSLTACAREFEFSLPDDEDLQLKEYVNGQVEGECLIAVGSKTHGSLNSWLASNTSEWHYSDATYAPGILVQGNNFSINVQDDNVIIVNLDTQFVMPINAQALSFLTCGAEPR